MTTFYRGHKILTSTDRFGRYTTCPVVNGQPICAVQHRLPTTWAQAIAYAQDQIDQALR
jgi:hypothetical protein